MAQPPQSTDPAWTGSPQEPSEVQTLHQELNNTRKKLQEYADTVVYLNSELRSLRENICKHCKAKFAPRTPPALPAGTAVFSFQNHSSPQVELTNFWRRMLKGKQRHGSPVQNGLPSRSGCGTSNIHTPVQFATSSAAFPSPNPSESIHVPPRPTHVPIHSPPSLTVSSRLSNATSGNAVVQDTEPRVPSWFVKQDEPANRALQVTFVCSLTHKDRVQCLRFSADGKYLAVALWNGNRHDNGTVIIYDVESSKKICALAEYASQYSSEATPSVYCVCFSPNRKNLVVGDTAGRVTVWDIPNKRIRNVFRGHDLPVESVDFSPNGQFVVSASWDMTIRIWNVRDGSAMVLSDNDQFFSVRFCPNGEYVVGGNNGGFLTMWNFRTGQLEKWAAHQQVIPGVAFTPDGRGLVSGSRDGTLKYWDISSLRIGRPVVTDILEYTGHTGVVNCVAVSPDAQWVASASYDKTILWDTCTAMRQCTLVGHKYGVLSVDFSPVGTYLATGSNDGHVSLWRY